MDIYYASAKSKVHDVFLDFCQGHIPSTAM